MASVDTGLDVRVEDRISGALKIAALAAGFVMATLDVTVVNVAGATIQQRMHTSLTELTWIVDGYVLTFSSLLMLAGALADRWGAKKVYLWGMAVFVAASLGCALSPDPATLIAARLVQGAGAALFMPSSLALLVASFPGRRQRARVLGLWSAIVSTAAGLGPTIGGLMVSAFGWRSIFLLNLPVGVIAITLTLTCIAPLEGRWRSLATGGQLTWIAMLAALSFSLIQGPQLGWRAPAVVCAYVITAIAAALLILCERHRTHRVMPWGLFRDRSFLGANLVGFLFNFALFGTVFLLGLYLQHARGASPFHAGLELLPMTAFFPIANVVYARISARVADRSLLAGFMALAGAASLTMVTLSAATPYWLLALAMALATIGGGIIAPAMTAVLVTSAGQHNASVAGSVLNTNRQIGSLVGIAATGIALHTAHGWNHITAATFLMMGATYLAGALCAWSLIREQGTSA